MTSTQIQPLADSLMRAVVASGVVTQDNLDQAVAVMRAELKALLTGDEYADERDCILRGSVSQQTTLMSVAASCIQKLR